MRTLLLHLPADPAAPARWALFEAPASAPTRTGSGTPDLDAPADRCWVLVGGAAATAHRVALPADSDSRHLAAAAAFVLEDALASDPADLHFALGERNDAGRLAVVVSHAVMAHWTSRVAALGVKADALLPDYLALPEGAVMHDGMVLARTPAGGFAAEPDLAALLRDSPAAQPLALCSTTQLLEYAYRTMAESLTVNLLEGRYAPRRDWNALFRPWRRVGALAAGILFVLAAGLAVEGARLNRQADAAAVRTEAVFRAALPQVKRVVNPRAQMRAHLQSMNLADGGFLALSETLVAAVDAVADAEITVLRFDARRAEIAATFSLPSFDSVERLKAELGGRGGQVQEGGARQDGTRVLADMTVHRP